MGALLLLLILGTLQGFHPQTIHVSQVPVILPTGGSSVTLPCTYSISGTENVTSGWYKWYRHVVRTGPEVTDSNKDYTGRISRVDADEFSSSRSASIALHRVHITDTGMYYCEVTFQHGGEISGHDNGTFLNVTVSQLEHYHYYTFRNIPWMIRLCMAGVLFIAALSMVGHWCHIKQDKSLPSDSAAAVSGRTSILNRVETEVPNDIKELAV